jgi:hypothetical protein
MGRTGRPIRRLILAAALACGGLTVSACDDEDQPAPIELDEHLYGPGAGLGHGVEVPDGAARIGPTITILQDHDRAVRQISLLQIDGDPDQTIRAMLADLARMLPDAEIDPSQSRRRCWLDDSLEWIRECRLLVGGHTAGGQPLQVDVTVTPTADADGRPLPGTTGLPEARVLVRTDVVRGIGTNLAQPPGFPYGASDQDAARWPIAAETAGSVGAADRLPGADGWPIRSGGVPIGAVISGTRYYVVAVEEDQDLHDVAYSYAAAVDNEGISARPVAEVGRRTTTSYEIDSVDGGPGAHLWAIDRPGTDYLFLRYWPTAQ